MCVGRLILCGYMLLTAMCVDRLTLCGYMVLVAMCVGRLTLCGYMVLAAICLETDLHYIVLAAICVLAARQYVDNVVSNTDRLSTSQDAFPATSFKLGQSRNPRQRYRSNPAPMW